MEFLVTMTTHVPDGITSDEVDGVRAREAAHPNDPVPGTGKPVRPGAGDTEFLVTFTPAAGGPPRAVEEATAREVQRARDLAGQGHLVRLWQLSTGPAGPSALGLWRADSPADLTAILDSLPLRSYQTTQVTKLTPHPSDPMAPGSRPPASLAP